MRLSIPMLREVARATHYTNIAYAINQEKRNDVPNKQNKNTQCSALELLLWHIHYLYTMKITFLINSGDFSTLAVALPVVPLLH